MTLLEEIREQGKKREERKQQEVEFERNSEEILNKQTSPVLVQSSISEQPKVLDMLKKRKLVFQDSSSSEESEMDFSD